MHEKFIHGTQKFVYLLVYLTGGSSFEVISPIYCRAKIRDLLMVSAWKVLPKVSFCWNPEAGRVFRKTEKD